MSEKPRRPVPAVRAYVMPNPARAEDTAMAQLDLLLADHKAHFRPLGFGVHIYQEEPVSRNRKVAAFRHRYWGGRLLIDAERGDVLAVTRLDRACLGLGEVVGLVSTLNARGIRLRVLDLDGQTADTKEWRWQIILSAAGLFAAFNEEVRRSRVAGDWPIGEMPSPSHGGELPAPPYGHRWKSAVRDSEVGKWLRVPVPDPDVRSVGREIVRLHEEDNLSFREIFLRVRSAFHKRCTASAGERMVVHYYHSEKKLQEEERENP